MADTIFEPMNKAKSGDTIKNTIKNSEKKRGRPKKYQTEEEKLAHQKERGRRWYLKNRDEVLEKKKELYHQSKAENGENVRKYVSRTVVIVPQTPCQCKCLLKVKEDKGLKKYEITGCDTCRNICISRLIGTK